jgi:hypothetical protein
MLTCRPSPTARLMARWALSLQRQIGLVPATIKYAPGRCSIILQKMPRAAPTRPLRILHLPATRRRTATCIKTTATVTCPGKGHRATRLMDPHVHQYRRVLGHTVCSRRYRTTPAITTGPLKPDPLCTPTTSLPSTFLPQTSPMVPLRCRESRANPLYQPPLPNIRSNIRSNPGMS